MKENKVAIYCRLSAEDIDKFDKGDDSESIQNQKLMLIDYSMNQGWQIYKIYVDEDYSGLDKNRPQFQQLIADAKAGFFGIILCKTQSRFTRDMEMVEKYINGLFVLWGVRFVSLIDNIDTSIKGNKKARQIYGLINEWYSEDLSDNIRAVFRRKMEEGQFLGSFAPYGYIKDPTNRHKLVIDEEAATVVREIYKLYLEGNGYNAIARTLTEKGILPPTMYKKSKGLKFENPNSEKYGIWAANSIKRILTNRAYVGCLIQGREKKLSYKCKKVIATPKNEWVVVENSHEPIIEVKTFELVQENLHSKKQRHKPKSESSNRVNILSGKVKCLSCGSLMQKGAPTRDGTSLYLRCGLAHKTKSTECSPNSIRLDSIQAVIEDKIYSYIRDFLSDESNSSRLNKCLPGVRNNWAYINTGVITAEIADVFVEHIYVGGRSTLGEREIIIYWKI